MEALREQIGEILRGWLIPISISLDQLGITPNQVSFAGAALSLGSGWLITQDRLIWAALVFLLGSSLDLLDGTLARATSQSTQTGAVLDSTLDRVSEGVVFIAIGYLFAQRGQLLDMVLVFSAALTGFLVSYVRARAEAVGIQCTVGSVVRPERVLILSLGMLFDQLAIAIYVLLILSCVTLIQRLRFILNVSHQD
ncbi:MAG: CDP-alcohol phosphatidyltransferase family protein [Gammaproteobacteria bacterium]|nr:CDP-alcohol phosphatidyltransferase family protein [Gammaproteobacteria bacterium]